MESYNENEKLAETKEFFQKFKEHLHLKTIGFSVFASVALLATWFAINTDSESILSPSSLKAHAYKTLTPGTSWQWQLQGTVNETILDNVNNPKKMYDIDLFDTDMATISRLKAKNITVICYFSAGSSENFRSDFSSFPSSVMGNSNGWSGEKWLDIRNTSILGPIMEVRLDLAKAKGCDGVEPDNVDGYTNNTGFPLTANDQLAYNKLLASKAHERDLSVGLKNDVDQVTVLEPYFDWALNEQCYQYNECGSYSTFINKSKAVLGVEYKGSTDTFCPKANTANYDWLLKGLDLNATPRTACREGNGDTITPTPIIAPTTTTTTKPITTTTGPTATTSTTATTTKPISTTTTTKPTTSADTIAPTVKITKPLDGSIMGWGRLAVDAIATDNVVVKKMEVYLDGKLRKTNTNSGSISWRLGWWGTNHLSKGNHTIIVKAYDSAGNISEAQAIVFKN